MQYLVVFIVAQVAFSSGHVVRAPWAECGPGPVVVQGPPVFVAAPPCGPVVVPAPAGPLVAPPAFNVIQTNDVAGSLADTLSLLTVSSLLADKLPYGPQVVVAAPPCPPPCPPPCAPPCGGPAWIV